MSASQQHTQSVEALCSAYQYNSMHTASDIRQSMSRISCVVAACWHGGGHCHTGWQMVESGRDMACFIACPAAPRVTLTPVAGAPCGTRGQRSLWGRVTSSRHGSQQHSAVGCCGQAVGFVTSGDSG